MSPENLHKKDSFEEEGMELFQQLSVPHRSDKAALWEELSSKIEVKESQSKIRRLNWYKLSAAASIVLLLAVLAVLRFYTETVSSAMGEQLAHVLPDGSRVQLNADSKLTYAPFYWYFNRAVQLEGEAFFEVKKGSRFSVHSEMGTTSVLGTSFNIFARESAYRVYCATGRVEVQATASNSKLILSPQQQAVLKGTKLNLEEELLENKAVAWLKQKFNFDAMPLKEVLKELERQYAVDIELKTKRPNAIYSGYFDKSMTVDTVLNLVCLSFQLKFEKLGANKYQVSSSK